MRVINELTKYEYRSCHKYMLRFLIKMFYPEYLGTHHATVRYAFSFVFALLLVGGLASVITNDTSYITINTPDTTVTTGQVFTITVSAFAHVPVNAVDVTLTYPTDLMVVDGVDTGNSVITLWTTEPKAENGKILLRGGTFRKGFIGEHDIARIKAHAISPGDARVLLKDTQFIAGDGLGTEVPVSPSLNNDIKIRVTGSDGVLTANANISVVTDTDADGDVDMKDVAMFMKAWLTQSHTYDFNGDGYMTFNDFSILLANLFTRR